MSWQIAQKDGKYRIWSTISDTWLTDWIDRKEAIKFYYDDALLKFKKRVIEEYYKFPHMWGLHNDISYARYIDDDQGYESLMQWLKALISKENPDEYCQLIEETYDKIMKELGTDEMVRANP